VSDEDIADFKTEMVKDGYSRNSVALYFRHLKAGFKRAVTWDIIEKTPFDRVENIRLNEARSENKRDRSIPLEYIRKLLEKMEEEQDSDFANYVRFLLYTGARRCEILYSRWEDIDLPQGKMIIYQEKNKKTLEIPINSSLLDVIRSMEIKDSGFVFQSKSKSKGAFKKDESWHKDFVSHHFRWYVDKLGLPSYTLHGLRHTFTNQLLQKGVPREFVHKLLGHSSERTTAENYDRTLPLHFRDQVELVTLD